MLRLILSLLFMASSEAFGSDKLWGPIDPSKWQDVPHLSGRLAKEEDVKEGIAVFYLDGGLTDVKPLPLRLPTCAILHDSDAKKDVPVIAIQGEETPKSKLVGVRFLSGGNGVCTLADLEILDGPDKRFK